MSGEKSRLVILDEWHGKYKITNEMYQSIANELVKSYEHLKYVPVASILFIENTEGKAKRQNKLQYATISKIPEKWSDIFYIKQLAEGFNLCLSYKRKTSKTLAGNRL